MIASSWFDGNLGIATASVSAVGLIAVIGLAFARETRGEPMPVDQPTTQTSRLSEKSAS